MKRLFSRLALVFAAVGVLLSVGLFFSPTASAACVPKAGEVYYQPAGTTDPEDRVCCPEGFADSARACVMGKYVNPLIQLLSVIAGVVVVGGVIWGAIQYGSSGGDAQKVVKGKRTITQALVGLVAFLLLGSFIQFMTPIDIIKDTSGASCTRQFLGLKAWYAYIPENKINPNTCTVSEDLELLPANGEVGVLPAIALAVVDDLLIIAAYVAVAFVIVGGIQYVTSQGNPENTKRALSTIINALIGLAVALVASGVVAFIGRALLQP